KVPNIRHLKPFGCQVTILTTSDHLGKFKGKANDGFLVGMLLIGLGQEWYFDLDYLTDSLGYTRFTTNPPAGTQDTNIIAEELARLQREEYEAHSAAAKHGFEFFVDTAALLPQTEVEILRNLVPATVPVDGASGVPAGSVPANSVPAGGVLAGSIVFDEFGDPTASASVPIVLTNAPAATSPLPPDHSLGSYEHTTRFPSPSDLGNH
nr:hypothetical protein [Tanacetum cinerariifolium]